MNLQADINFAIRLDREDPLAAYRDKFHLPLRENRDPEIYFCGNSLGLQPKSAADYVRQELEDWKLLGVKGHFSARKIGRAHV